MRVLLINPPVYDFSCFDYWLKPLGLLYIAQFLKQNDIDIYFFDFMHRYSSKNPVFKEKKYSTGNYYKQRAHPPSILKDFPRPFYRYGIPTNAFIEFLQNNKFDFAFITSMMTYWYIGIKEIIDILKEHNIKSVLGGIYTRLLPEHAQTLGADTVFTGSIDNLPEFMCKQFNINLKQFKLFDLLPAYDVYKKNYSAAILTQTGCPFNCSYCAIHKLNDLNFANKEYVLQKLDFLQSLNIRDITFYDDAILYKSDKHFKPIFESILKKNYTFRFHFSNGLHVNYIDDDIINILKELNTGRIALSVESVFDEFHKKNDNKTEFNYIEQTINKLKKTNINPKDIYVYLIAGIPQQSKNEIIESIKYVHTKGLRVLLNEFSPVPGTSIYDKFKHKLIDPILTNKSVFSSLFTLGIDNVQEIKSIVKKYNRKL